METPAVSLVCHFLISVSLLHAHHKCYICTPWHGRYDREQQIIISSAFDLVKKKKSIKSHLLVLNPHYKIQIYVNVPPMFCCWQGAKLLRRGSEQEELSGWNRNPPSWPPMLCPWHLETLLRCYTAWWRSYSPAGTATGKVKTTVCLTIRTGEIFPVIFPS